MKKAKVNVIQFPSPTKKVRAKAKKQQMIVECMPLVRIVARIVRKTPPNVEYDDLVSCGVWTY